jgi:hypothetical protein
MKKVVFSILVLSLLCLQNISAHAAGKPTHSAYRVTSYNLGALQGDQNNDNSRYSNSYNPLLITNTATDILNSEHEGKVSWTEAAPPTSNTSGVAVSATLEATQNISLQGAFGVTRNLWAPDSLNYENESSWEANLGIIYKLLKNISYELHFGYMDTGNLFTDRSSYTNVESIIMISNQLTMSF